MNYSLGLNLHITSNNNGGYRLAMQTDYGHFEYTLPVTQFDLYNISRDIKDTLGNIVRNSEYSRSINITQNICERDLEKIADLNLFNRIFLGLDPLDEANECVGEIRRALKEPCRIQIITDNQFFIPWSLLYEEDLSKNQIVTRESFWGFKHVIEQMPVIHKRWKYGPLIDASSLQFGFNVNNNIDSSYNVSCVADQKRFFDSIKKPFFINKIRTTEDEVFEAFKSELEDKIVYFYCHAKNDIIDVTSKKNECYIQLTTPDKQLTLNKLEARALKPKFKDEPLVFINACESAGISPLFYDGFVPYFTAKGSRGVIGTISQVPAVFASEFALRFFDKLLRKQKVGEIIIQLRNEFLNQHNNLLGLYYVSYSSSNLILNSSIL